MMCSNTSRVLRFRSAPLHACGVAYGRNRGTASLRFDAGEAHAPLGICSIRFLRIMLLAIVACYALIAADTLESAPIHDAYSGSCIRLDLASRGLDDLAVGPQAGESVSELILRNNRFTRVPAVVCNLPALRTLDLSANGITSVPACVLALPNLQSLELADNEIGTWPRASFRASALEKLTLARNHLLLDRPTITAIMSMPKLRRLDLSNNVVALPMEPFPLGHCLTELLIGECGLTSFVLSPGASYSLAVLDLSANRLSDDDALFEGLVALPALRELKLRACGLRRIAPSVGHLTQLEVLDIAHNTLHTLPEEMGNLGSLEVLAIAGNRIPATDLAVLSPLARLRVVDLSHMELPAMPGPTGWLQHAVSVNIRANYLSDLPMGLLVSQTLSRLDCANNNIRAFPCFEAPDPQLLTLDISGNCITAVNDYVGNLLHLENLFLHDNQIEELSPRIGLCSELRSLVLNNNSLTHLPGEVGYLKSLEVLDLRHNQLADLPQEVCQLEHLRELHLGANKIRRLPPNLQRMRSLRVLGLYGNPVDGLELTRIRREVPWVRIGHEEVPQAHRAVYVWWPWMTMGFVGTCLCWWLVIRNRRSRRRLGV